MIDVLFFTVVTIGCLAAAGFIVILDQRQPVEGSEPAFISTIRMAGVLVALGAGCLAAVLAVNALYA